MKRIQAVGVIGAGIAGLACAQRLCGSGMDVTVLEKSRGVGGRVATRRTDSGATFDHGAQFFTVQEPAFEAQVKHWIATGAAAVWPGRIVTLNQGVVHDLRKPRDRYVGVPGMTAIAKSLAQGLNVRTNITAHTLRRLDGKWQVEDTSGDQHGPYDFVVSTAPPLQTKALFTHQSGSLAKSISKAVMGACWVAMLQAREPLQVSFDAAFVQDSPLSWIARDSSKPERQGKDCWILHASATWSEDHLEEQPDAIARALVDQLWQAIQQAPQPYQFLIAHRWLYSLPLVPLEQRFVFDGAAALGACGDWCGGPRVEGAFLSGRAMAEALLDAT